MHTRVLARISVLVAFCFVSMMAKAQTPAGLTHKWSAEGDGLDSIGGANCLTSDLVFTTGHSGQAFRFDGTLYPDFGGDAGVFGTSDFTIDFWMQTSATRALTIFSRRSTCEPNNAFECWMDMQGYVRFGLAESDANAVEVVSTTRANDGTFHHVAVVRRSQDVYLYFDGIIQALASSDNVINIQQMTPASDDNPIETTPEFIMGNSPCVCDDCGNPGLEGYFVGALDQFEMYNVALDDMSIYQMVHPGAALAIVNQPFNQRTLIGRRVVFHVGVVGQNPLSFQWKFNGLDIPGVVSNNLEITNAQTTDSGSYCCVVSNPAGDATSRSATLVVTNLSAPQDSLLARWSAEGNALDSIGGFDGKTSNIKYAPGVVGTAFKMKNGGGVTCTNVMGGLGTGDFTIDFWMSTTFPNPYGWAGYVSGILGEHPYLGWPAQVASFTLHTYDGGDGKIGSYIVFEFGTQSYAAYFKSALHAEDDYCTPNTIASPVHLNDGVFHHVAAVRRGNKVTLYVDGKPVQTSTTVEPLDYTGDTSYGADQFLMAHMLPYIPFVIGQDHPLDHVPDYADLGFDGSIDEVQIHSRALTDAEIYSEYSPDPTLVILQSPQNTSIVEGGSVTLSVSAGGAQPYTYQWRRNGTDIFGATDSTYAISAAQISDAGSYSVAVANGAQSLTSPEASLTVVSSNSLLPGLINRWSADGNADDLMRNSTVRSFSPHYSAGVAGQSFNLVAYEDGWINNAGSFDVSTGNFGTNDFTMGFWLRTTGYSPRTDTVFQKIRSVDEGWLNAMGKNYGTITNFPLLSLASYYFDITSFNRSIAGLEFIGRDMASNTFRIATGQLAFDASNFHHVAIVRRAMTGLELFLDGSSVAQTNVPNLGNLDSDTLLKLPNWGGQMDEIEIYNRALTATEIAGLHNRYANTPRITGTFHTIDAFTGNSVTLSVNRPGGPGPFSYQWTLNGTAIAGATDSTLAVTAGATSCGIYALTVSNGYGAATMQVASLSLQLTPGSYNGLFYLDEDTADESSGYVQLTLNTSQTYSGKLLQHGKTYPFAGRFSANHSTPTQIKRPGKTPLNLSLSVDGNGETHISGVVNDGKRIVPLKAHRNIYSASAPTPQAGTYTIAMTGIKSATAPNGHSFGNVTILSDGTVKFGANLADNTQASQKAMVASSGSWPLYIPLYGGKGSIMGWLSFTNSPDTKCAGELRWIKPPGATQKNYQSGFATKVPVIGSTFAAQTTGLGIDLMNYSVTLDGPKIYTPVSGAITNSTGNAVKFAQANSKPGTITATPRLGQFSGSFMHPVTKLKTNFKGVVLQDQGEAAGYFISGNLSGRVVLKQN